MTSASLSTGDLPDRRTLFIGGRWAPGGGPRLHLTSPVTGQPNGSCVSAARADIDAAVDAARRAVDSSRWPSADTMLRVDYLGRLRRVYFDNMWTMHHMIRAQNGSLATYTAQVTDPLEIMRQVGVAADDGGPRVRHTPDGSQPPFQVGHHPVGVVVAITCWDMPQKALAAKLAPALVAGCAVIVVPSPHTPLDALYLAEFADVAGLPPGVLSVLPIDRDPQLLEYLVTHAGVDMVTFTGPATTGAQIASWCAPVLRRVAVHGGCRSAAIVDASADLEDTVRSLRTLALGDSGQMRCAVARLVVHAAVASEFAERMRAMMRALKVGDPQEAATDIGPLVSTGHQHKVLDLIRTGNRRGLRLLTGLGHPDGPGCYVYPALFADVAPGALPELDTLLGPVLTMHTYRDDDHAIAVANAARAGSAAAVYSGDQDRARALAGRLRAGTVHVNGTLASVNAPHGPLRHGGLGREVGPENIAMFRHLKVVVG